MCERDQSDREAQPDLTSGEEEQYELVMVEQEVAQRLELAADANNTPYPEAATKAIQRSLRHHEEFWGEMPDV